MDEVEEFNDPFLGGSGGGFPLPLVEDEVNEELLDTVDEGDPAAPLGVNVGLDTGEPIEPEETLENDDDCDALLPILGGGPTGGFTPLPLAEEGEAVDPFGELTNDAFRSE